MIENVKDTGSNIITNREKRINSFLTSFSNEKLFKLVKNIIEGIKFNIQTKITPLAEFKCPLYRILENRFKKLKLNISLYSDK